MTVQLGGGLSPQSSGAQQALKGFVLQALRRGTWLRGGQSATVSASDFAIMAAPKKHKAGKASFAFLPRHLPKISQ